MTQKSWYNSLANYYLNTITGSVKNFDNRETSCPNKRHKGAELFMEKSSLCLKYFERVANSKVNHSSNV